MATFLLIRHGDNPLVGKRLAGRLPGVHLDEKGRQQADELAGLLKDAPICAIYSSPLERAYETATPLAVARNLVVQIVPGVVEIDYGTWMGRPLRQLKRLKSWKTVLEEPAVMRFPGGETFGEAQARAVAEIERLAANHSRDDLVAVFSHADIVRLLVAHYLGLSLNHYNRLWVDTSSISVLRIADGKNPLVLRINQVLNFKIEPPKKKKRSGQ